MNEDPSQSTLFDPAPVQSLFALQEGPEDAAMVQDIIRQFIEDTNRMFVELENALSSGNLRAVSEVAHSLKGGAATFGLPRLRDWAFQLEQDGKHERSDRLAAALHAAQDSYAQALPELEALLQ
jgi:HPt (histidine-containing phosphotransfer) domain-containing protein